MSFEAVVASYGLGLLVDMGRWQHTVLFGLLNLNM